MKTWIPRLAIKYLFPYKHKGTFFTWISICGVTAGVTTLVVVLSIMNGFDKNIEKKLSQINGPIQLTSSSLIKNSDVVMSNIEKIKNVKAITQIVQGIALAQHNNLIAFPKCLGLDSKSMLNVIPIDSFLKAGKIENFNEGAFIGYGLANELNLKIGDVFDVYSPLSLNAIKRDEILLPQELKVCGIIKTGWMDVDQTTILLPINILQDLYGLKGRVNGFSVNSDSKYLNDVCIAINDKFSPLIKASTWYDLNADFLAVLKLEKTMCFFVLLFIVIVATFSMCSGIMTTIIRKQREISLLRTWGATNRDISILYVIQSLIISVLGLIFGFVIAHIVLINRNVIIKALTGWILSENTLTKFYNVESLPMVYSLNDFLLITIFTIIITLVSSILPVLRIYKIPILKGLRSE